jgi:aryl-alcohol dehydrogenase-like predicted oxidoreductase
MEYRYLGQSGLKVSTLTFGTATFGAVGELSKWGSTDAKGARSLLELCVEAGVNLVDTANFYSQGRSEEILGEALGDLRHQLLIASKVRFAMGPGPNDEGLSRHHIIAQCEASLRRLRTDWIDLYQMHEWDGITPLDETLEAFDSLVRAGKVRYVGISNFAGWQLMKTISVARANRYIQPVAQQIYYSLETRDAEYELIPASIDQKIGILVWSPLAGGLLSGKYRRGKNPSDGGRHLNDWYVPPIENQERLYDKIELLIEIAEGYAVSAAEVALAWLLTRPAISSLIIGARTEDQLRTNLHCVDLKLSQQDIERLEAISRPRLLYPHWHQRLMASSRLGPAELSLLGPHLQYS